MTASPKRVAEGQVAISDSLLTVSKKLHLALLLNVNAAHISLLMNKNKFNPKLENAMIEACILEPRPKRHRHTIPTNKPQDAAKLIVQHWHPLETTKLIEAILGQLAKKRDQ